MKKTTKVTSYLLMLVFVFVSAFFVLGRNADAATDGYFNYTVNSDNATATITSYTSDEVNCVIPKKVGGYTVTAIGYSAFSGKTYMTSVTIPNTVTSIDDYAFKGCKKLASLTIPNSVVTLGYQVCYGCPQLQKVTIGSGVKELPNGAFANSENLTTVNLSYGLEKILGVKCGFGK